MTTLSASWELQKALVAFLKSDGGVQAVFGTNPCRLFDDIPEGAISPFVIVGDEEEDSRAAEEIPGTGHMFALTVVSTNTGFQKSKEGAQTLKDVLEQATLTITGFEVGTITYHRTSHRRNPDQATFRQSTLLFEVELRPTSS